MKKIAVILSGCGVFDGSEIHEAVLTLLSITQAGASYQCFAPNISQFHVINHLTGEVESDQQRNVLVESARIARGDIQDLAMLDATKFDALVLPGGFGAAKNLSDFAFKGADCQINVEVLNACQQFAQAKKPAAYICIAPALIPLVYGPGVTATIGTDPATADQLTLLGANHQNCEVNEFVMDETAKVISTPAYMLAGSIAQAAQGIDKTIKQLLVMIP